MSILLYSKFYKVKQKYKINTLVLHNIYNLIRKKSRIKLRYNINNKGPSKHLGLIALGS